MAFRNAFRLAAVCGVFALELAGCAYRTKEHFVNRDIIGNPDRMRITNFLSAPLRPGRPSEMTPGQISRAAVADEATLTFPGGKTARIEITARTHVSLDVPMSEWRITAGGREFYAVNERVEVCDYNYSGTRTVIAANAMGVDSFASLKVDEPAEYVYRVIERRGHIDIPLPSAWSRLDLEIVLQQDDWRGHWGENFVWQLR